MNIKKFISSCLLCGVLPVFAAPTHMILELNTNETVKFRLSKLPEITFTKEEFIVNGDSATTYAISDVKGFYFEELDLTGLKKAQNNGGYVFSQENGNLTITNAQPGLLVQLYNMNGQVLNSLKTDKAGSCSISLPSAKGVYVITIGNFSLKIRK